MDEVPMHQQAMLMAQEGKSADAIAAHFGVEIDQVLVWLEQASEEFKIFSKEAQRTRLAAFPPRTSPFSTATRMRRLLNETIDPLLSVRRYLRAGSVWYRAEGNLWRLIDVQAGKHPSRTFRDFTLNWGLFFARTEATRRIGPGVAVKEPPEPNQSVVFGRIGAFSSGDADLWWAVERGWLGRYLPPAPIGDDSATAEIVELLASMLDFLDAQPTLRSVVDLAHRIRSGGQEPAVATGLVTVDAAALNRAERWLAEQDNS